MNYPFQTNRQVGYYLQWWSLSGPYDPFTDFGVLALQNAITNWHIAVFPNLVRQPSYNSRMIVKIYIQGSAGLYSTSWPPAFINYTVAPTLPASHGVVVQRFTAGTGPRSRGRFFVPFVPTADCDGRYLKNAAQATWQASINNLLTPIIHSGVTFTPCLVSYVGGSMVPITRLVVTPRLGLLHRRARVQRHSPSGFPKAPPP
jgi:hypothetical protein